MAAEGDKEPVVKSKPPPAKKHLLGGRSMTGIPADPGNSADPMNAAKEQQPDAPPSPPQQQPPAAAPGTPGPTEGQQLAAAGLEHYKAGRIGDAVEHYQAACDQELEQGNPVNPQLFGSKPPSPPHRQCFPGAFP